MFPSRRVGRPPRPPSSFSIRMAKAQARQKGIQGIYVLILKIFKVFVADLYLVALSVQCESIVGVAASNITEFSGGPILDKDAFRGTISGGLSSLKDNSGEQNPCANQSGGPTPVSKSANGGSLELQSRVYNPGVHLETSLDSDPSFLVCSPFPDSDEDVRVVEDNSDQDARVVEDNSNQDGRVIEDVQVDRRRGKKPLRLGGFTDLDPELVTRVNSAFENPLETKDEWIRGRFDAWRLHVGKPIDRKLEEIALDELADNLEDFMLCVRRIDGKCYPLEKIWGLQWAL